mmetsp:Transcript_39418/g.117245  ORF Transcript_39418/g.117245 Transcript_39418/m.117245 type:complete len:346 (-) Transcript_39418:553-1590(-)
MLRALRGYPAELRSHGRVDLLGQAPPGQHDVPARAQQTVHLEHRGVEAVAVGNFHMPHMHDVEAARVGREHVTPVVVDPDLSLCEHRRKPVAPDRLGVVGHGSVVALELAVRRVGRDVVVLLALDVLHVERPRIGERATDRLAKRAEHGVGVEHVGEGLGLGHERQQLLHIVPVQANHVLVLRHGLRAGWPHVATGDVEAAERRLLLLPLRAGQEAARVHCHDVWLLPDGHVLGCAFDTTPAQVRTPCLDLVAEVVRMPHRCIHDKIAALSEHSVDLEEPGADARRANPVPAPLARDHVKRRRRDGELVPSHAEDDGRDPALQAQLHLVGVRVVWGVRQDHLAAR